MKLALVSRNLHTCTNHPWAERGSIPNLQSYTQRDPTLRVGTDTGSKSVQSQGFHSSLFIAMYRTTASRLRALKVSNFSIPRKCQSCTLWVELGLKFIWRNQMLELAFIRMILCLIHSDSGIFWFCAYLSPIGSLSFIYLFIFFYKTLMVCFVWLCIMAFVCWENLWM